MSAPGHVIPDAMQHASAASQIRDPAGARMDPGSAQQRSTLQRARDDGFVGTRANLLTHGRARLAAAGIESAALDARVLLQHVTGLDHAGLTAADRRDASLRERARYEHLIAARARRVPVAYLTGEKEFYGRLFAVSPAVLIPRPETEHLVDAALAYIDKSVLPRLRGRSVPDLIRHGEGGAACAVPEIPPSGRFASTSPAGGGGRSGNVRVLDLGTGSGAILLSILAERANAIGIGIDRAPGAIAVAQANAVRHGLAKRAQFAIGNWSNAIAGQFDIVTANPPYLTRGELVRAQGELHAEPHAALDGGEDGLQAYRALVAALPRLLVESGIALVELGAGQAQKVAEMCIAAGLKKVEFESDLAGCARVLKASIGQ